MIDRGLLRCLLFASYSLELLLSFYYFPDLAFMALHVCFNVFPVAIVVCRGADLMAVDFWVRYLMWWKRCVDCAALVNVWFVSRLSCRFGTCLSCFELCILSFLADFWIWVMVARIAPLFSVNQKNGFQSLSPHCLCIEKITSQIISLVSQLINHVTGS